MIWDPRIYYFFEIPNTVEPKRAILVMVAGTCFAVLGALIPAVRAVLAGRQDRAAAASALPLPSRSCLPSRS